MRDLKKNSDREVFLKLQKPDGTHYLLSYFDSIEIVLRSNNKDIRVLKVDNTLEEGKFFEYDDYTIQCYLETRDSNVYSVIDVYVKVTKANAKLSDGIFNKEYYSETFRFL